MDTKSKHTTELLPEGTDSIIALFFEFAQLKNLYRQGWLKRGISKLDCESVADHCFGVALLGYVLAGEYRPDLDPTKVMRMGLFHEIGEIYAGDIIPQDMISPEDKFGMECAAVEKVFSKMPEPGGYVAVWREYGDQKTPEARFVKQVDKLEMALQANVYERLKYQGLDEFFIDVNKKITSPELRVILDELLRIRD